MNVPAMQFTHAGQTFRISFRHERFDPTHEKRMSSVPLPQPHNYQDYHGNQPGKIRGRTTCAIRTWRTGSDPAQHTIAGKGVAECSMLDVYDKELGRQLALKRAVMDAWPTPNRFWELAYAAYANRSKRPAQKAAA